jgi:hypothetical protein
MSGSPTLIRVVLESYTEHGAHLIKNVLPAGICPVSGRVIHYLPFTTEVPSE